MSPLISSIFVECSSGMCETHIRDVRLLGIEKLAWDIRWREGRGMGTEEKGKKKKRGRREGRGKTNARPRRGSSRRVPAERARKVQTASPSGAIRAAVCTSRARRSWEKGPPKNKKSSFFELALRDLWGCVKLTITQQKGHNNNLFVAMRLPSWCYSCLKISGCDCKPRRDLLHFLQP